MEAVLGLVVVALGASGAAAATQQLPALGHGRLVLPALVLSGAVIGGGAALVRGWDLTGTVLAGATLVPVLAIVVRLVDRRRDEGTA